MSRTRASRWLQRPLLNGRSALACGVAAVLIPTIIRYAVNGVVTGCEFTPYLPFVLLAAVLLRWWQAAAIALAQAAVFSGIFLGSAQVFFTTECAMSSAGIFLAACAMIVATVVAIKHVIAITLSHSKESSGGVVFSMEDGQVWASWYGQGPPVCLGSQKEVGHMMEDFLAQEDLARRLARRD